MKKIFVVVVVLVVGGILNVKAFDIGVDDDLITFEYKYYKYQNAYDLSPYGEYNEFDTSRVNNLAYIGRTGSDITTFCVIQLLIWQTVNPEYNYRLVYNGNEVNIEYYIRNIERMLDELNEEKITIDYTEVPNSSQKSIIPFDVNLAGFKSNYDFEVVNDNLIINGLKNGINKVKFTYDLSFSKEGYVYATKPCFNNFDFDIRVKNPEVNISFETYKANYKNDELIKRVENNLIIKDLTQNKEYTCKSTTCNMLLETGKYTIISNSNLLDLEFNKDETFILKEYVLNGIVSNNNIKFLDTEFTQNDKYYDLIDYDLSNIKVMVGNKEYNIDLNDESKYEYIDGHGIYYRFDIDDDLSDIPKEDIKDPDIIVDEKKDDEISLEIPDTNIDFDILRIHYVDEKKYYYKYCFNH